MDLQDFKAFAEANDSATRPFKRIIYSLIAALLMFIALFGGSFFYFMYKAFNMGSSSNVVQEVEGNTDTFAYNNARVG